MALRVVARHRLEDALPTVVDLQEDPLSEYERLHQGPDADLRKGTVTTVGP